MRINKFLASNGIASRRAIDAYIQKGRIAVNGNVLTKPGYQVQEADVIVLDGKKISQKKKEFAYILFNKPTDCITTNKDTHDRKTVLDFINISARIFPIGRLDKDTTGALLLTNDGELAHTLMHPRYGVEKVYQVQLDKQLVYRDKKILEQGVMLDKKKTVPCDIRIEKNNARIATVILHEGINRQIRRMFDAFHYTVQTLDRVAYAGLTVKGLTRGEWRYLTEKEVSMLKKI